MVLSLMLGIAAPARASDPAGGVWRWRTFITEASLRFGIPTRWIERVMQVESAGRATRNGAPIRSRAGAIGLMQVMPATWADMRDTHGLGRDPDDPRDNILAGTAYLRAMYDRFGYPGLFGAYNAGPGRYAAHLGGRAALPGETIAYLALVTGNGTDARGGAVPDAAARAVPLLAGSLFAVREHDAAPGPRPLKDNRQDDPRPANGLFAIDRNGR